MGLTEQQSGLLRSLYTWLQQRGMSIVPARPVAEALQHLEQLPDQYIMDLNLAPKYDSTYPCDERELVQNYRDRCADLSRTQHIMQFTTTTSEGDYREILKSVGFEQVYITIEDLSFPCITPSSPPAQFANGYWEHSQPHILGHIVQYIDAEGMRCLDLCNHATVLSVDMFRMGGSDKDSKAYTAGHFGEGMKVQINRLIVDRNLSVTYNTGPCLLSFFHTGSEFCPTPALHLHSTRWQQGHGHPTAVPSRREETVCSIRGPPGNLPAINSSQYLFLQQPQTL